MLKMDFSDIYVLILGKNIWCIIIISVVKAYPGTCMADAPRTQQTLNSCCKGGNLKYLASALRISVGSQPRTYSFAKNSMPSIPINQALVGVVQEKVLLLE